MHKSRPYVQKITGTGSAITVTCGFKPQYVRLVNETTLAVSEHVAGMAAARAVTVDDSGANATDVLLKTSNGITLTPVGFIIGTDSALNNNDDVIYVIAW